MANIQFIEKRIAGKEKELDKLNKKLERIYKAQATNWEVNPYYYHESDIKWTLRDIEKAKEALDNYKNQLQSEIEKANSRDVKVIIDFLDMWKKRVRKFYEEGLTEYYAEKKACRDACMRIDTFSYGTQEHKDAEEEYKALSHTFWNKCRGYYEKQPYTNRWGKEDYKEVKIREGEYEYLFPYSYENTIEEALAKLDRHLDQEANRKYDFIIERTNAIVGEITDASNLRIGAKSDLNGYIIGTRGTAKVQTIGAGGYNIQCFHFRTLINQTK